jgi:superfamily II DNA or RNA helicase
MTPQTAELAPSLLDTGFALPRTEYSQVNDDVFDDEPETETEEMDDEPQHAGTVSLRHYQRTAVQHVFKHLKGDAASGITPVQKTLVVMATGTGKTVTFAELTKRANDFGHGVLLLVHRDELIRQISKSCARVNVHTLIEKAQERALPGFGLLSKTVCASVATLRGARLEQWPRDTFKLIIVDEAHHSCAQSYRTVLEHFNQAKVVGFTATPDRLDGANIGQVFDSLAYEYNLRDAIHDPQGPFLVPLEAFPVETSPPIDLRDLRITAGDFNLGDLETTIQNNIGTLVNALVDTDALQNRRTIAFTPDVKSAEALSLALNDVGITANWVAGKSPNRREIFHGHQTGKFQVLVNCMIATEGYDDPAISCVLVCRPTKSRALYSQMVGRGTRIHPESDKQNCRIVDFAYITDKHSLVSPVDLYDNSDTPDSVVERARELVKDGSERNIDEALERAQVEFEDQERVRIQRRAVAARAKTFNPLDACDVLGIRNKASLNWNDTKPATPKMIETLRKFKIDAPDDMAFGVAKKLLDTCITRAKYKLATPKQVEWCIRLGADPSQARAMSFSDAGDFITANKTW